MNTRPNNTRRAILALTLLFIFTNSFAQSQGEAASKPPVPICSGDDKPYRDFDFVVGEWEMFSTEGDKIGEQVYVKREQGCLITEEWTTVNGGTGHGMTFVDSKTGLWRQVYVSPLGQIDYSGGIDEKGAMVLEGMIYPTDGNPSAPVRGIWTPQEDGSIRQEFLMLNRKTDTWITFFLGIGRAKETK